MKIRDVFLKEWELSTKSAYFILALSIVSEQAGTACLEASDGYRIASFSILTAILYTFTYFTFGKILSRIDLGIAWATWGAVGTAVTPIAGYLFYKQKITKTGIFALALIIVSTITLNVFA
ncbi:MAG: SMR family transporter [Bacillota bacterium]|nr:SMR family transporter [Bacillota bacterium]